MANANKFICNPVTGQSILFIQTGSDTAGQLLEMESRYAPYSAEPPAHYHPKQQEVFSVLEGNLLVCLKGETIVLRAGDRLKIPANTIHAMWNPFDTVAVVNWKVQPALNTEYLLETTTGLASVGKVNRNGVPHILQTALLMRHYREAFRLIKPSYFLQQLVFGLLTPIARLRGYKAVYPEYIDRSADL